MVSSVSIGMMAVGAFAPLAVWVVFLIVFFRHYRQGARELMIGIATFLVAALILERIVHLIVLQKIPATASFFSKPLPYAIYGCLMAGLFEESGRYLAFRLFFKKRHRYQDALAYGLGHGGLELLLVGVLAQVSNLANAVLINNGTFSVIAKNAPTQAEVLKNVQAVLVQTHPYLFAVSGLERVLALALQVGLSVLVLYAVARRRPKFYLLAIGVHALADFFALIGQDLKLPALAIEGIVAVFAVVSIFWIVRARPLFEKVTETPPALV